MSKRISLLAAAASLLAAISATSAQAQDWQGFYVGAHTGYGFGDVDQPYGAVGGPFIFSQASPDVDGWIYGLQGGFNWNAGSWVFGGELQGTWGDREGDDGGSGGDVNGVDITSEWSLRGRAGFLLTPSFLLYGTAGWVSMDVDATAPLQTTNETIEGWTYGIGGEWMMSPSWSGVIEWRTDEMDETRFSFAPAHAYDEGLTPNTSAVRIGVNWHPTF